MSEAAQRPGRALPLVVLLAGAGTLGIEMIASRMLAPYFGTSQPIWAAVIGLTLAYLAAGYHFGGRLADRRPDERLLYRILLLAGLLTAAIPLLARPILGGAQAALAALEVGGFLGALLGVLALFAAPITLLAMVSPFAARLQLRHERGIAAAGRTVGTLSALSTVGSIAGTFLTVLLLIPALGTARTTLLYAGLLALLGASGLRSRRAAAGLLLLGLLSGATLMSGGPVKAAGCAGCSLLAEAESPYNYIQVAERDGPRGRQVVLMLNEGLAVHSIYNMGAAESGDARDLLTGGGPWDYFAVAPFFYPGRDPADVRSMAMLGAGAGTAPAQFLAIYGADATVDAVEIDPDIIALGRRYFGLRDAAAGPEHPNYRAHAADARYWLATRGGRYDIIGIDAYHQPYIPFHLTTVEFFTEVRAHLTDQGAVAVNAGLGPGGDDRLGQAIAASMRAVFPEVYIIETGRQSNQIIVGLNQPVGDGWGHMVANYERLSSPALRAVLETVGVSERPVDPRVQPLTDDRAPVEALVDSLIFEAVAP
jgi:hypothetical protein